MVYFNAIILRKLKGKMNSKTLKMKTIKNIETAVLIDSCPDQNSDEQYRNILFNCIASLLPNIAETSQKTGIFLALS